MSTADKSTLPPAVANRSTIQHILSENSPKPPVVPGEELKNSEEDSTWVPELPPRPRQLALAMGLSRDTSEVYGPSVYEADGGCGRSSPYRNTLERNRKPLSQRSSPPHYLWLKDIKHLLDDAEGVSLFTRFLEDHCDKLELEKLNFCFACTGLKKVEPEKIHGLVRTIYKKYFREKNLGFPSEMRERLSNQINERGSLKRNFNLRWIFEEANAFMLDMISKTSYLAFLNSPLCLNYSLSLPIHDRDGSNSSSSSSVKDDIELGYMTNSLSTVHEGKELVTKTPIILPLKRGTLIRTQNRRLETAPKMLPSPYHTKNVQPQYISCNPVSSQDSDARTESDLSLTDGSMDGTSSLSRLASRSNHKNPINKDMMRDKFVSLTQKEGRVGPPPTDELLRVVAMKLNEYLKEQENAEQGKKEVKKKMEASDTPDRKEPSDLTIRPDDLRAELNKVINRDALQLSEENSQDILDKHCKRVFSSDQTPVETPNPKSPPRNKSPDILCRRSRSAFNPTPTSMSMASSMAPPPVPAHGISSYPYSTSRSSRKKDKDGMSIVSVDSGNIHDFPEGSEHYHFSPSLSSHHLPKSKSMPDYAHSVDHSKSDAAFLNAGHRSSSKWWSNKKAGDLTDSGVSVVSDTPPVIPFKDNRNRLRSAGTSSSGSKSLPQRSGSSEQCLSLKRFPHSVPAQQFTADTLMSTLESHDFADEVGKKLMENSDRCRTFRSRHSVSSKGVDLPHSSYPSTLRRSMASQPNIMPTSDKPPAPYPPLSSSASTVEDNCTIVVYSFCNDEVPYRTKIPGNSITLKQFKDFLPKKGAFRFFFKTNCDDPDIKVIQEEIFDDNDVLPLWEGKIMAQVKSID